MEHPEISAQKIDAQSRNIELAEAVHTVPVAFSSPAETAAPACYTENKKVVSHKHASCSVNNVIVNAGNADPEKTQTVSTSEVKTVVVNVSENSVAENSVETVTPVSTIEPMVPVKPRHVNIPAPLFDQLNSPKKELRLLVDIIHFTETTSKN